MPSIPNRYERHGKVDHLIIRNRRGEEFTFIFDHELRAEVEKRQWMSANDGRGKGIILARCTSENNLSLHHLIFGEKKKIVWQDGNHFNCRRQNLGRTYPTSQNPSWRGTAHISKRRFSSWKYHAARRKKEWRLTIDDIEEVYNRQNGLCPLSGRALSQKQRDPDVMSLDRIDASKPYMKDNVQLVTSRMNYLKRDLGHEELVAVCAQVVRYARRQQRRGQRL